MYRLPIGRWLLLALPSVGCSGSSTSPPAQQPVVSAQQISTDVAYASGPEAARNAADFAGGLGVAELALRGTGGALSSRIAAQASPCEATSSHGRDVFPASSKTDTVIFSQTVEYFSAGGCQDSFSSTTDSIEFHTTFVSSARDAGKEWERHAGGTRLATVVGDPTLSAAPRRVWDATWWDMGAFVITGGGQTRTYASATSDTAGGVTYDQPQAAHAVPASGTVAMAVTASLVVTGDTTDTINVARRVVVTFDGGAEAALQVFDASGALALTCSVDLSARRVAAGSCAP